MHSPAAARRDASELLHVDVDQVADAFVPAADGLAQLPAARWGQVAEPIKPSPDEDAVHGGRCDRDAVQAPRIGGETGGPVLGLSPQCLDQAGERLAGTGRARVRTG
ncbi:hypothetical protein ACVNF4_15715 [Streptomyces sp. S6]